MFYVMSENYGLYDTLQYSDPRCTTAVHAWEQQRLLFQNQTIYLEAIGGEVEGLMGETHRTFLFLQAF